MKKTENETEKNIDLAKLSLQLNKAKVDKRNSKIILNAASCPDFEKALLILDKTGKNKVKIETFYTTFKAKEYVNINRFSFLYKMISKLKSPLEAACDLAGVYGKNSLRQLDTDDAFNMSLSFFVTGCEFFYSNVDLSYQYFLSYDFLFNLDKQTATRCLKNVLKQSDERLKIAALSIFIRREDMASEFKFEDMLEQAIKRYFSKNFNINLEKFYKNFDPFKEKPNKEFIEAFYKALRPINSIMLNSIIFCFDKGEFLQKFVATIMLDIRHYSYYYTNDAFFKFYSPEEFVLLGTTEEKFIDFINQFADTKIFVLGQIDINYVIKHFVGTVDIDVVIKSIKNFAPFKGYVEYIIGNKDFSDLKVEQRFNYNMFLDFQRTYRIPELYDVLFKDDEIIERLKTFIDILAETRIYPSTYEMLSRLNAKDDLLFEYFDYLNFYRFDFSEFLKNPIEQNIQKQIVLAVSAFKGRTKLIERLMETYKDRSLDERLFLIFVLADNIETNKKTFESISESSKQIQTAIYYVYKKYPELSATQLENLKSKKLATRKSAFNILKFAYGGKFNDEIKSAFESETNSKLKAEIETHLAVTGGIKADGVDFTEVVKTLVKSRNKVEAVFKNLPPVHDKDKNEADEQYIVALLCAYAAESSPGFSLYGRKLAEPLNQKDLEALAMQVLLNFWNDGGQAKYKWVLYFCAIHGGKPIVKELAYIINEWASSMRGVMASEATKALALNPSPESLAIVDSMSRKHKYIQVRNGAKEALKFAAEKLGITTTQLSDRIVPNLGFDDGGKITFDYGERKFDVYLNMAFELEIVDQKGAKLKTLPAVGKNDDQQLAENELSRFKDLKKQLKTTLASQTIRLDMALSEGRRWQKEDFFNLFVKNPIMLRFATGLVFGVYSNGILTETFRYSEDGSFNTSVDQETKLQDGDEIGIIHPLDIEQSLLDTWRKQFSDYEITQPLEQLNREVFSPTQEELSGKEAFAVAGRVLFPTTLTNKLLTSNWLKGEVISHAFFKSFVKLNENLGIGAHFLFSGCEIGSFFTESSTLKQIMFYDKKYHTPSDYDYKPEIYLDIKDVDKKFFSEIVREVLNASKTFKEIDQNWRNVEN